MAELALKGGEKVRKKTFPQWPHYDERDLRNVDEVIRSRRWFAGMRGSDPDSTTRKFEHKFSDFHQVSHGIACCNGTAALEISLRAAGIGDGDEVIIPGLTFIATMTAVLQVNATPVVVDVLYNTQCIDPDAINAAITDRTRAIIPVHFGGFVCDMESILRLATKHDLVVIEDAAHAHGAVYKGQHAGSLGHLGAFSFQESKTMTAGEGGIITTNDEELAEKAIMYRACGRKEGESWYKHHLVASNHRLSEIQSALLLAQLERLPEQLKTKNRNADLLAKQLADIEGIRPLPGDQNTSLNGYYLYLLQYNRDYFSGLSRDRLVEALEAEGIPCHIGYPWPLTHNPVFVKKELDIPYAPLPVCNRICTETIVIPHRVLLSSPEELEDIGKAIRKIQRNTSEIL